MSIAQSIVGEFSHEAGVSRRLLEAVPGDQLAFKPHPKSMTLGRLAGHIAEMPRWALGILAKDELDLAAPFGFEALNPSSTEELLRGFDEHAASFKEAFADYDDAKLMATWTLKKGDHVITSLPRIAAIRGFVLNHVIHHRAQLTVFLRLLDVPLPQVYGPTADNPSF